MSGCSYMWYKRENVVVLTYDCLCVHSWSCVCTCLWEIYTSWYAGVISGICAVGWLHKTWEVWFFPLKIKNWKRRKRGIQTDTEQMNELEIRMYALKCVCFKSLTLNWTGKCNEKFNYIQYETSKSIKKKNSEWYLDGTMELYLCENREWDVLGQHVIF